MIFLCTALCLVLTASAIPAEAFAAASEAAESEDTASAAEDENAESFRYDEGMLIDAEAIDTDSETETATIADTLAREAQMATTVASWKKSNGTSSYTLGSKTVSVSGVKRVGIDVSHHQGNIKWGKVANSGIDYAIIRCGYGSNKKSQDDTEFLDNVEGAQENGIEIGVYLYSHATSISKARGEAKHALRLLDEAGLDPNDLDLPVFYDIEDSSQSSLGAKKLGNIAEAFCDAIEEEGYVAGVYSSKSWWEDKLTASEFTTEGWYRWVARYSASTSTKKTGVEDTSIWQFTSQGTVSGISGDVDVDFDYLGKGSYSQLRAFATNYNTVKLTWSSVADATGYQIKRKTEETSYETIADVSSSKTSYSDTGLDCGTTYSYRIRAVYEDDNGEETYGSWWRVLSATPTLWKVGKPNFTLSSSLRSVKLSWGKIGGATGYEVYRAPKKGGYKKVKTTKSRSWKNGSRSLGVTYRYKVRAYRVVNGEKVYGPYSNIRMVTTAPTKVRIKKAKSQKRRRATVTWKKSTGAKSYQLAYRRKGSKRWKKVTVKGTTKKLKGLSRTRYYVKVRGVRKVKGKTYHGSWSKRKSFKVK